jgi:L-alanine-DL-glutamate epimerase-like enolase superfamily enzyme
MIEKVSIRDLQRWASPGDNYLFVEVHGEGAVGWYGPIAEEPARCVVTSLTPVALGASLFDHAALNCRLRVVVGPCPTPAESWAVGALDCAVWDLHGRLAGKSVANLLSALPTPVVRLYSSWLRLDLSDPGAARAIDKVSDDGWLFTKWGLRRLNSADSQTEAARLARLACQTLDRLNEKAAFDALYTWDSDLTARFASHVDPLAITWVEDPLHQQDPVAYRELEGLGLSLATGERLHVGDDAPALLSLALAAFTLDVVGCGGLSRAVDLVALATTTGTLVYPHGRSLMPAMHLAAAFPTTVPVSEYQLQWEPHRQRLYTEPLRPVGGQLAMPAMPGLGVTPRSC